jgi:hypothetical protein
MHDRHRRAVGCRSGGSTYSRLFVEPGPPRKYAHNSRRSGHRGPLVEASQGLLVQLPRDNVYGRDRCGWREPKLSDSVWTRFSSRVRQRRWDQGASAGLCARRDTALLKRHRKGPARLDRPRRVAGLEWSSQGIRGGGDGGGSPYRGGDISGHGSVESRRIIASSTSARGKHWPRERSGCECPPRGARCVANVLDRSVCSQRPLGPQRARSRRDLRRLRSALSSGQSDVYPHVGPQRKSHSRSTPQRGLCSGTATCHRHAVVETTSRSEGIASDYVA